MSNFILNKIIFVQTVLILITAVFGVIYVRYTWIRVENAQSENVLQIARSIETTLPVDDIKKLEAKPSDIEKPQYRMIKNLLKEIIRVNNTARFAYIYTEQTVNFREKLFINADSEPEDSKDYSPPGQEYTEADIAYFQPFKDGKEFVTNPVVDRWGTWRSVFVPIKDTAAGKIIAVFAMDFDANYWNRLLLYEVTESSIVVVLLLIVLFISISTISKNNSLKNEIAGHKKTVGMLRESEEKYRLIFEYSPVGLLSFDDKGVIIACNDNFVKIIGSSNEMLIGLNMLNLPDKILVSSVQKALDGSTGTYEETYHSVSANKVTQVRALFAPMVVEDGRIRSGVGIIEDISERKQAEETLLKSEIFHKNLLNSIDAGIVIIDPVTKIIETVNVTAAHLFGTEESAILGNRFHLFLCPAHENCCPITDLCQTVDNSDKILLRHDGSRLPVLKSVKMITIKGKEKLLETFIDITERKQAQEDLLKSEADLRKLNSEKDKFFSIIAHDLRSPFTGFLGLTELMVTDMKNSSLKEYQEIGGLLHSSATNLFGLLTNLLEWSKMQRGLTAFNPEKLSLKRLAEEVINVFDETAKKKGIKIEEEISEEIFVTADKRMLETIARNLISNALKFTKKGGSVTISAKESSAESNGTIEISVKDSGIGMDKELMNKLFKIDTQTSRKGTDNERSTGLGLLLCKEFIEKHKGEILVESEEGKGSRFSFTLKSSG